MSGKEEGGTCTGLIREFREIRVEKIMSGEWRGRNSHLSQIIALIQSQKS